MKEIDNVFAWKKWQNAQVYRRKETRGKKEREIAIQMVNWKLKWKVSEYERFFLNDDYSFRGGGMTRITREQINDGFAVFNYTLSWHNYILAAIITCFHFISFLKKKN